MSCTSPELQEKNEHCELVQASYVAVGKDFHEQEDLIKATMLSLQTSTMGFMFLCFPSPLVLWLIEGDHCAVTDPFLFKL